MWIYLEFPSIVKPHLYVYVWSRTSVVVRFHYFAISRLFSKLHIFQDLMETSYQTKRFQIKWRRKCEKIMFPWNSNMIKMLKYLVKGSIYLENDWSSEPTNQWTFSFIHKKWISHNCWITKKILWSDFIRLLLHVLRVHEDIRNPGRILLK